MLLFVTRAWAGWTPTLQSGAAGSPELDALAAVLAPCPYRPAEYVARFAGGKLLRFGPVAGSNGDDGEIRACLEAGLQAAPPANEAMVSLRYADAGVDTWRAQVQGTLDQVVGPRDPGPCARLRFPVSAAGTLGTPTLVATSGDPALDQAALRASTQVELPRLPTAVQQKVGGAVEFCVAGKGR